MPKPLVVVESPTKIRTIKKYLGENYTISATVGHIKDLPYKEIGVDLEHDFKPLYITIPGKQKILKKLKKDAGNTTDVYLASDPDREGEAIAWHTAEILEKKGRKFHRVLFHELTKKAIIDAMASPKNLDKYKYKAQQARRILDRLVGYEISPLLWSKVKRGLSAGRVQSVSVKIICEREKAIRVFTPIEYWSIKAEFKKNVQAPFTAKLTRKNGNKITISTKEEVDKVLKDLSLNPFLVHKITKKIKKRNPPPPFITSKLQQESIKKLGFSAKKTMLIAQQLYEGVDTGPGDPTGLITYMRTDSVRISEDAATDALKLVKTQFGINYVLDKPRFFKNKKKTQDAHEAIRPTSVFNTPKKMIKYLSKEQIKIYTIIWQRFMASQMKQALIDQTTICIKAGEYDFTVSGSIIKFLGFTIVYQNNDNKNISDQNLLPNLKEGNILIPTSVLPKQHFTLPPPRFSEASLVKELEENGIGRPSTYATIISNIREKGYVELSDRSFKPTELGLIVNDLLTDSFPEIIDVEFTAVMENQLDLVEQSEMNPVEILSNFYRKFSERLSKAKDDMLSVKGVGVPTNLQCPMCKKNQLRIRMGKNGHFVACSRYPDCTYSSDYKRNDRGEIILVEAFKAEITDEKCKLCNNFMAIKIGKYGKFLACTGYPQCKNTKSIEKITKNSKTGIKCPKNNCGGDIVEKLSKRGKLFYSCSYFPNCNFASWYKPINITCPKCNSDYLIEKFNKKSKNIYSCPSHQCTYTIQK